MRKDKQNNTHFRGTGQQLLRMEKLHYLFGTLKGHYSSTELIDELERLMHRRISKTTLIKDLKNMRSQGAPIPTIGEGQHGMKYYYEGEFSSNPMEVVHELTCEERDKISALVDLVASMKGIPELSLQGLAHLKYFVNRESRKIISYEENPSQSELTKVNELFEHIAKREKITFSYCGFHHPQQEVTLHPQQLRQYDLRFYLIGLDDATSTIRHFPVDRISNICVCQDRYNWCDNSKLMNDEMIEELYRDVVGITIPENQEVADILFWVSDNDYKYVVTKPIHHSQITLPPEESERMRQTYHVPEGGFFLSLRCKINYELCRELVGYGKGLVVLQPQSLNSEFRQSLKEMAELYGKALEGFDKD